MQNDLRKNLQTWLGSRFVLVIEPSTNYRSSIKQFLINLKVKNMKFVSTVADARREMLTTKVGFFIAEWGLDQENGLTFCRNIRKEPAFKDTPFLLLSTDNLRKDVILASEVKIDGYLLKPFSYEEFCNQFAVILRNHMTPGRINGLLESAEDRLKRGDTESAGKLFTEALSEKDSSARAMVGLARIRWIEHDAEGASKLLRKAMEVNPDYIESYKVMLEIAESRNNRAAVIQYASVLHDMSPENPKYALVLARSYLELSHYEASEKFFKRCLALSPRLAEAFKGLGNLYMAQDEYEKAMKNFKKALDLDENDISTLNSLGTAYVRVGQLKAGIDKYLVALKLDPQNASVLFNIGHAYEKKGDFEKAKWYYAQSLIHKPGFDKPSRGLERLEKRPDNMNTTDKADDSAGLADLSDLDFKKSS